MVIRSDYTAGTVTVSAGGTVVTGVGTGWLAAEFQEGDVFIADGWYCVIASVDSNTQITLYEDGGTRGGALAGAEYRLRYMSNGSRVSAQARELIDMLGASGNLQALGGLNGSNGDVLYFTGPGTLGVLTKADITMGVRYDAMVDTLPGRDAYDGQPVGFTVLVADTGDGRAALYVREGGAGNWSAPAYITGPSLTLAVDQVDPLPYGDDPTVTLNSIAGGYELNFGIPQGMEIVPGTVTTLMPGASATVDFVPVTGGYRLDFGLPKGDTGTLTGLTPFYQTQVTTATDAASARDGLEIGTVGTINLPSSPVGDVLLDDGTWGEVDGVGALFDTVITTTPAQRGQARANIDAGVLAGFRNKIINGSAQIIQRGSITIAASNSAYVLDRFRITNNTNQSVTVSQHNIGVGSGFALKARYAMRMAFAAAPTTGTIRVEQRIEFVDTVSPGDATFIAWMAGPTGSESLSAELVQNFGTGGSPSSQVVTPMVFAGDSPTTIYSASTNRRAWGVTVPSLSGKLLGSSNNDYIAPAIIMTPRQSGNYDVTWVSFVEGDATAENDPFSPRHVQQETALCQRYFQKPAKDADNSIIWLFYAPSAVMYHQPMLLPVTMRAAPTVSIGSGWTTTNSSGMTVTATPEAARLNVGASGAGNVLIQNNTGTAKIELDAEL